MIMYKTFLDALHVHNEIELVCIKFSPILTLVTHQKILCQLQFLFFLFLQILHEHFMYDFLLLHL